MRITVNPDKDTVSKIREAIKRNDGYCPCQIDKNENTRCMCKNFLEQDEDGWCHCHLYYKQTNA